MLSEQFQYGWISVIFYIFWGLPSQFFNWLNGYAPVSLRILCVSMLIMSLGKILSFYEEERKTYLFIKIFLYLWFTGYWLFTQDIFTALTDFSLLDWSAVVMGIVAPFCLLIVGYWLRNIRIGGIKIINFWVIMILYLILGLVWFFIQPETIVFSFYFIFWFGYVIFIYEFSHAKRGLAKRDDINAAKNLRRILY